MEKVKSQIHLLSKLSKEMFYLVSVFILLMALFTICVPTQKSHAVDIIKDGGRTSLSLSDEDKQKLDSEMSVKLAERNRIRAQKGQNAKKSDVRGSVIIFDVSTPAGCNELKRYLKSLPESDKNKELILKDNLCTGRASDGSISIFVLNDPNAAKENISFEFRAPKKPIVFNDYLPENSGLRGLIKDTVHVSIIGAGIIGGIAVMPESVSNWSEEKIGYIKNITQGPVVDEDNVFINWVGHPYSGAMYYVIARNNGFSPLQSFGYSCLMSTFYWEYGLEAYFEVPSIQDLFITPIIGSLMGFVFELATEAIYDNGGKLLGSEFLGDTAIFFMDLANPMLKKTRGLPKYLADHGISLEWAIQAHRNYNIAGPQHITASEAIEMDRWSGVMVHWKNDILNDFLENIFDSKKK